MRYLVLQDALPRLKFGADGRALGVVRSSSELASELSLLQEWVGAGVRLHCASLQVQIAVNAHLERLLLLDHELRTAGAQRTLRRTP